jgi:hypothetical protein
MSITSNPCSRCGKERIVANVWSEEVGTADRPSNVTHTMMVCPDADCQKKVEKTIAQAQEKRAAQIKAKEEGELRRRQHPAAPQQPQS